MESTLTLTVNGAKHTITTDAQRLLLDVIREDLGLTGTKSGCGEGQCGACTVLLDGKPVHACRTPVAEAGGKSITTIEGLASGGKLHPVQEAFLAEGAMQCGYCTAGMLMTAAALLQRTPQPSDEQIVGAMNGNVCRCNGYVKILRAIRRAARVK
jgi:aerobic-type carbon monoxide dehydrogenase small subunit (CoxS/CutS family)